MTDPNEPTLLAKGRAEQFYDAWALRYAERPIGERFIVPHSYEAMFRLMDEYAHSWRERRVQELEECLREIMSSATPNQKEHPTMFAAWTKAEKTLQLEWREQIRKGAKHESDL